MAQFLNTSATNYYLEELIKQCRERLIIISPFLKFNDRMKELLQDKDRLKIDVRIVYGKSELAPREINWLRSLEFVRTSFCNNLHAKCYLSERAAIITSMNLYDFSQVNNNEMGVFVEREKEPELYREILEEAQRLIRISEQVRLSAELVKEAAAPAAKPAPAPTKAPVPPPPKPIAKAPVAAPAPKPPAASGKPQEAAKKSYKKLSTSELAKEWKVPSAAVKSKLLAKGYIAKDGDNVKLTPAGIKAGGEPGSSEKYGPFFVWPKDLRL